MFCTVFDKKNCCSIALNIVLALCSVTKANTHLKVFFYFESFHIDYFNTVIQLCSMIKPMRQLIKLVGA